jgi:hypothetical protein
MISAKKASELATESSSDSVKGYLFRLNLEIEGAARNGERFITVKSVRKFPPEVLEEVNSLGYTYRVKAVEDVRSGTYYTLFVSWGRE